MYSDEKPRSLAGVVSVVKIIAAEEGKQRLWYLATPYSKYPHGIIASFQHSAAIGGALLKEGVPAFGPISHSHPMAAYGGVKALDHSVWLPFDQYIMEVSAGIIVATMDGWSDSYGVTWEIEQFKKWGRPILYLDPTEILTNAEDTIKAASIEYAEYTAETYGVSIRC